MGPKHQARGNEPNQIECVVVQTHRHYAGGFYQVGRRTERHRNASGVPVFAAARMALRSRPARVPQDELDFVTRDADIAQLTVGKLRQLAALPRSFGHGQAVAGALAPPLRQAPRRGRTNARTSSDRCAICRPSARIGTGE